MFKAREGPDGFAIILLYVEAAEVENGDVESRNAVLRRRVKHCLQQRALELVDLSGTWTFGEIRSEANWIGGVKLPEVEEQKPNNEEQPMATGGGGLSRAFCREYKDDFKVDGKVSFSACNEACRYEQALPHSEKFEALREKANLGPKDPIPGL